MASHDGQSLREMPVEGNAQSLVLKSGTLISGLNSENHEVGHGFRVRCKQRSELLFGQLRQPRGCG